MDIQSNSAFTRKWMPTFFKPTCLSNRCMETALFEVNFVHQLSSERIKKIPVEYMKLVGLLK